MSALGELIKFVIYGILFIPVLIVLINLIAKIRNRIPIYRTLVWGTLLSLPFFLFAYKDYAKHRKAELKYVGRYILTDYPNCINCKLELLPSNTYEVTDSRKMIETGKWCYKEGGDYFIVEIGDHGRLVPENINMNSHL